MLDLLIRGKTSGKASLDDVMRRMYEEFYLQSPKATYYLRGRGYKNDDLLRVSSEVAGTDLSDFFKRYVRSTEVLPYDEAFGYVGLSLVRAQAREPYDAGLALDWRELPDFVIGNVRHNSPAEDAGLQQGDELLTLGGKKITRENWPSRLNRYKQGDRVPISVRRDRRTIQTVLVLGEPERFDYRIEEKKGATPEQKALRAAWLKGG